METTNDQTRTDRSGARHSQLPNGYVTIADIDAILAGFNEPNEKIGSAYGRIPEPEPEPPWDPRDHFVPFDFDIDDYMTSPELTMTLIPTDAILRETLRKSLEVSDCPYACVSWSECHLDCETDEPMPIWVSASRKLDIDESTLPSFAEIEERAKRVAETFGGSCSPGLFFHRASTKALISHADDRLQQILVDIQDGKVADSGYDENLYLWYD